MVTFSGGWLAWLALLARSRDSHSGGHWAHPAICCWPGNGVPARLSTLRVTQSPWPPRAVRMSAILARLPSMATSFSSTADSADAAGTGL